MRLFCLILALPCVQACASGRPLPDLVEKVNATLEPQVYRVGPGDVLRFTFPGDPNWNQDVTVDELGSITLRLVGSYQAGDRLLKEVQAWATAEYSKHLPDPTTMVTVVTVAPRNVYVLGEVTRPGPISLAQPHMPILEALGSAGGHVSKSALLEESLLVRWQSSQGTHLSWRIDASTEHWGSGGQLLLQAGDVLYVPKKRIVRVNEWLDHYVRQMIPFPYLVRPTP